MRIAYVLTSLGMGGAERQALAQAQRMAERGHTVAILVLRSRLDEEWPTKLDTLYLNMRKTPFSFLKGLAQARRFLLEFKPDLLHSHSFHANIVARLLKVLVPGAVVLSTVHNVYEGGCEALCGVEGCSAMQVRGNAEWNRNRGVYSRPGATRAHQRTNGCKRQFHLDDGRSHR